MLKRFLCAALAATLLLLCACQKKDTQSVSDTAAPSAALSENQETTLAAVPETTAAGDIVLPESKENTQTSPQNATTPPKETQTETPAVPTPPAKTPAQENPKTQTVSLSVTCQNAINDGILENPNFQGIVPENGVYYDNSAVEFETGESVLQVLKRCLKAQKIVYQIDSSGYVKSIGGLSEFACGAQSGWLYKVNGELPNVSTKYYTLHAGDRVEFVYTCRKGDV